MLFNSDVELPLTSSLCDCDHNSRNFALEREFVYILEWKKKKKKKKSMKLSIILKAVSQEGKKDLKRIVYGKQYKTNVS